MTDPLPGMRRDLEFFPIQYGGEQLVLIKDHLGLVQEGKALPLPLFQMMALFDGTRSLIDLQTLLMRQGGGVLVGSEEIKGLLTRLDESFLLDSERFRKARDKVVADFSREPVRNCSHGGNGYPAEPDELRMRLDEILSSGSSVPHPGDIRAVVSPHIDLAAGRNGYANAYNSLKGASPSRIIVLGIGHRMADRLFCLTGKDFQTPLGVVRSDKSAVQRLRASAPEVISEDDFAHRSEHSIEFQILFLQHIFPEN
ncbi:MAG: AmmeMemoRadiSam system protein B, partial [Desulfobacterales bacterium]|nr:AmmeMemoRadiSam system protein B [Desulfobacterales bacterium]